MAISVDFSTPVPLGILACIMLGPGTSVTHAAVNMLGRLGCLLLWVGENGTRLYSAGRPGGGSGHRMLEQANVASTPELRLLAARRLYQIMCGIDAPRARSIEQLRGLEGRWVRTEYARLARTHGIEWRGRNRLADDPANKGINVATSTLYGAAEAVILALGLSPAIGIVHTGDERSLAFDVADTIKFKTVVPIAFATAAEDTDKNMHTTVRRRCRDLFRSERILEQLVAITEHVVLGHAMDRDNADQP